MKAINTYITEKLHINNTTKIEYIYHPKDKDELIECIKEKIDKEGLGTKENPLNLNDIDTYKITDMSDVFSNGERSNGERRDLAKLSETGYFDISDWDVSNVKNMNSMFYGSGFNGNISNWNVSNVEDMRFMFSYSTFTGKNGNISKWDVGNVKGMSNMFAFSKFNGDISDWDVSGVEDMRYMFWGSSFTCENGDISNWDVRNVEDMYKMFNDCPLQKNPPKWYKTK